MLQRQPDLFEVVAGVYADTHGPVSNTDLYRAIERRSGLDKADMEKRVAIGQVGAKHSPIKRKIRWFQQTLKHMGVIEHVEGQRGIWQLSQPLTKELDNAPTGVKLVAFHTDLGVAIWGRNLDVFGQFNEPITLVVTSPPYPLKHTRAYGNPAEHEYVDFICSTLEPIVRNLVAGGHIVLNVGNDIFMHKSPARSLYIERLVLALHDRLGLSLMDRIPWVNTSKSPGPTYWACVNRVQLLSAHEPIFWFTNDPSRVRADNRRVLEAHTQRHLALLQSGGENRTAQYGDGAYRIRPGSFGTMTSGKIPRNVIQRGHVCADTKAYRQFAHEKGLPTHGAMYPTSIPDFFIRFLTEPDDLVVDPFGGTVKTGLAAERLGRRWLVCEWILQYLQGGAGMFRNFPGFSIHPALGS